MPNSRVPQTIAAFDSYINVTSRRLLAIRPGTAQPNYALLGLTPDESDAWASKGTYWHDTLYPVYSNTNTCTSVVRKDVALFMKAFRVFANPLLNRMAASSNAIAADEAVFRFVIKGTAKPTTRGKIEDVPFLKIQPMGGGELKFRARMSEEGNRCSRHAMSDAIEIRWMVVAPASNNGNLSTQTSTPPTVAVQCTNMFISTKALFIIALGQENKNKIIYCFIRWINLRTPANNGPWSDSFQSGIL